MRQRCLRHIARLALMAGVVMTIGSVPRSRRGAAAAPPRGAKAAREAWEGARRRRGCSGGRGGGADADACAPRRRRRRGAAPATGHRPTAHALPPPAPPPPEPGSELSVYVLTMGPGDHPFFKFGHNAIWIQDRKARTDKVYNFGTFRFDSPKLLPEFMKRAPDLLAVGGVDPAHARGVRSGEPHRRGPGAGSRSGGEARAARSARRERAAREPQLQVRLLPRQLLDARARRHRRGDRRAAAHVGAGAGAAHAARPGAAPDGRLHPRVPRPLHRARPVDRSRGRSLGGDVHPARARSAGCARSRCPGRTGRGRARWSRRSRPCSTPSARRRWRSRPSAR